MALEYRIRARSYPSAVEIRLEIMIERSEDGDTFDEIARFRSRHDPSLTDNEILTIVDNKVTEFVKADANLINTEFLDERAVVLVEALDGRSYLP